MWLLLAFCSAALLGFYDVFKKKSLANNAVLPVLGLNTLFSSLIFLPFILVSYFHPEALQDTLFYVPSAGWEVHKFIILKSFIVLSSWTFGYFGMKHLPLTIVGPINATRPVMTLVGALLIFGERLNVYQWIGVLMAIISFFMLSRSGKKEGIDFKHDKWIWFVVLAAVLGAVSGLYDKYLMGRFNNVFLCAWYGRGHDFHRVYGATGKRGGFLPVWCHDIPREEPEEQGGRFDISADWYVLPLLRKCIRIITRSFLERLRWCVSTSLAVLQYFLISTLVLSRQYCSTS